MLKPRTGFKRSVTPALPKRVESTGAKGLISNTGRNGGTFAHKDVARDLFKIYLIYLIYVLFLLVIHLIFL